MYAYISISMRILHTGVPMSLIFYAYMVCIYLHTHNYVCMYVCISISFLVTQARLMKSLATNKS